MTLQFVPVGREDVGAVHALFRRWETHWRVPVATSADEIAEEMGGPHLDPGLDVRGAWSGDRLVAMGSVYHVPSGTRLERVFLHGRVDPDYSGCGLGRRLLAWQIERAVEKLRQCDPSLPWYVRAHEYEWITNAHHLYHRFGMAPVRWFEELVRPLAEPLEVEPPEGVDILPWEEADTDEIREVANASFADHWGSTPRTREAWKHLLESSTVRPDLSMVAVAQGRVVGMALNSHYPSDEEVTGRLDGWIDQLGVLRDWRRGGVASALVAASLHAYREAGLSRAMLGVDAESPTGASSLYRRLGFQPTHRSVTSQLQIRPRPD